MFTFKSIRNGKVSENYCSIEQRTHLLMLEQKSENEEWARYIRLTGKEVERMQSMFLKGNFSTSTRPYKQFKLENGFYIISCRQDNQVIRLSVEEMGNVFRYYEINKQWICRYDMPSKR